MVNPKHPAPLPLGLDAVATSVIQGAKTFFTATLSRIETMKALADFEQEPAGASKAARDLSEQEAFNLLMHLVYRGEIFMDEPIRKDATGRILHPKPGQQLQIRTRMAGVDFYQASNTGFVGNHYKAAFTPRPAFAIVLYRLAQRLGGGYYGATRIVWGGIGHGGEGKILNCHEIGTCVDFYGAYTRHGNFDVLADWGKKPVFQKDGSLRPGVNWTDDKWGSANQTTYRLRSADAGLAYWFFADVYKFAVEQCTVGSMDVTELTEGVRIQPGTIIHPDYPDPGRRQSHQEHMHFQLGDAFVKG
jgi:hypothetical protein